MYFLSDFVPVEFLVRISPSKVTLNWFLFFPQSAILALFLNIKLQFNSNASTTIFHANELILYFFSMIGAIIADSWLGLFKTISLMTLLMSLGAGLVAVASIDDLQLPIK